MAATSGAGRREEAEPGAEESRRLREAREAVIEGLAEALGNMHRLRQRTGGAPGAGAAEVPHVDVGTLGTSGELMLEVVRLQVDILNRVLAFSRDHGDQLLAGLTRAGARRGGARPRSLRLAGAPGRAAEGRFVVENASALEVEAEIRATAISDDECGAPFEAALQIRPERARVPPGGEVTVEVRLDLDAARFAPRQRYRAQIEVASPGQPLRRLPLIVEVEEAPGGAAGEGAGI